MGHKDSAPTCLRVQTLAIRGEKSLVIEVANQNNKHMIKTLTTMMQK